jgi:hemolysin activation/secretion protein
VAGKGETYGVRLSDTLPGAEGFYHSVSIGLDFKYYRERLITGETNSAEPITSYPFSIYYNATWADKKVTTDAGFGVNFHVRGMGSSPAEFNTRRTKADGGYVYVHGTLSHERELPWGLQVFGQVQGQLSNQPLLSSEKISGGGVGTVRGYLEAEATGDHGAFASLELRGPSLAKWLGDEKGEWRCYAFGDWGILGVSEALPEEKTRFELVSVGLGSRIKLYDHFNGSIDAGVPLKSLSRTKAHDVRVLFQAGVSY